MVEWKRVEEVEYRESRERERERESYREVTYVQVRCTVFHLYNTWCTKYHGTNKPLEF